MKKHTPVRTCLGCGRTEERRRLLRLVRDENGTVAWDLGRKLPGRGAWVHAESGCIEKGLEPRRLSRAFRGRSASRPGLAGALLSTVETR